MTCLMCTQEFQRRVTEGNVPHAALVTLFEMRRFDFTNLSAGTSSNDITVVLLRGDRLQTGQPIAARGLTLAGWIANRIDAKMNCFEENLAALKEHISAPLLGIITAHCTPEEAAARLHLPV